ncbi:MAG: KpsF/GutQ family sugar-phosphate isomerase [Xanthobacteraceae bacterium]|nr:KpsF/GutQ family sugar-phosphate isomerase [Xanthobacteraceae bacterium]QYK44650.1 MAG: KpsF/GutQ family sugar-phosphate isomerase [Xanthobacteraceae bacterium]
MQKPGKSPAQTPASLHTASALRTLETEAKGMSALSAAFAGVLGQSFADAVERIRAVSGPRGENGRVIVTGMGKSGHVGRKIAATLSSTGTPAYFVHPGEASHGDLGVISDKNDVILALSWSGETAELRDLVDYANRFSVTLLAVTSNADSALARAADIVLLLPAAPEACPNGLAPTTSTLMQLALGDALAVALLESRGFTALDFKALHPGGKLGANLRFVRDLMHTGERVPLVQFGTPMSEAIVEMSAKGFGCVGIVDANGALAGIVTDGDLRRHMSSDLLGKTVESVMTRNPKTARPDQLAAEVLEHLNTSNITALFVVEDRKPSGLIHLHDLLRIGVA